MNFNPLSAYSRGEIIDAIRLALQSAVAASLTYFLMDYFKMPEKFLGVLSAVFIVAPSIGHTVNSAQTRLLATIIGSAIGFGLITLMPGSLGKLISLFIVMFIMNGVSGFKPEWRYGVVAALAITLSANGDTLDMTVERLLSILVGVIIGVVVSLLVWPDKAENRANRHLLKALAAVSDRFENALENTKRKDNDDSEEIIGNFNDSINKAAESAKAIRFADRNHIQEQIENTKKLYNSLLIIHRVGDQSYKKISDKSSGIEKDTASFKSIASEITKTLSKDKKVSTTKFKELEEIVEKITSVIENSEDDKRINTLRQTLVFGITEVKDSLANLIEKFNN